MFRNAFVTAGQRVAALALMVALPISVLAAQRSFVSTTGNDANTITNCANAAPCRSFGAALSVTDPGGEILVLSSGGYGPVTINQSVSLIAPEGVYAGISVFSGNGVTIATAGVEVTLRGIAINGLGGTNGINMTAGAILTLDKCVIKGFGTGSGVTVTGVTRVSIIDTLITRSGAGVNVLNGPTVTVSRSHLLSNGHGILVQNSGGASTTVVAQGVVAADNSSNGVYVTVSTGNARFDAKDSSFGNNSYAGLEVHTSGGTIKASVANSGISDNGTYGIVATGPNTTLVVRGNTITRNGTGLWQGGTAAFESAGDNVVRSNTTAQSGGTITTVAPM
ncbi:MAG: right-handed parallel beta-helix repeat-containing protein [Betaproteobacteria bacterium]|nr:right-handed parallel beta-helix repeat-containing protein [Betaproteobacteria bacterium]